MDKIRFFYHGSNLEKGKEFLKSSKDFVYKNMEDSLKDYHDRLKSDGMMEMLKSFHVSRCPAINQINNTGWLSFNPDPIHYNSNHIMLELNETIKGYPNSEDYMIKKVQTGWHVNIPKDHYLMSIPTLYHTKDWVSFPGIIDPSHSSYGGYADINVFVVMKKEDIIPKKTPLCQWILVRKNDVQAEYDLINDEDNQKWLEDSYIKDLKLTDYEKYKQLKDSGLFERED